MPRTLANAAAHTVDTAPTAIERSLEQARALADSASHAVSHAGEEARHWLDDASEQARRAAKRARQQARAAGTRTRRYIRDEPVKSTLLAAAGGALVAGLAVLLATRGRD